MSYKPPQAPFAFEPPDADRPATAAPTEEALESETISAARAGKRDPYAAWKESDFCRFSLGFAATLIAGAIQSTAIGWEIYQQTGRAIDLSWLGLVQAIPIMIFALPAGHVADRFDRRKVVMLTQFIALLCSATLALLSHLASRHAITFAWVYAPLFVANASFTFGRAARHALLPSLVPRHAFTNAVTWNATVFELSSVLGPAVGGGVIAYQVHRAGGNQATSLWLAYALSVLGQAVYLFFLAMIRSRPVAKPGGRVVDDSLASGLKFVFRNQLILGCITLDLFAVLLGGATYLLPIFAVKMLGVGAIGFGCLRAAPSVGAICMALLQAHLPPMKRAGRTLLVAVAAFGFATIGFGLSRSFTVSLLMLFLTGAFDNISVVIRHTLVQILTPDDMRGRVSAVNNVFIGASNDLGGWESGLTAQLFGLVPSVVVGGIGTILTVLLVAVIWPEVRRFGSLHDAKASSD